MTMLLLTSIRLTAGQPVFVGGVRLFGVSVTGGGCVGRVAGVVEY